MSSGGIFNHYSNDYSPETKKLLQVLMQEAKLSVIQRKDLTERMLNGEPLPRRPPPPSLELNTNLFDMKKNYYFKKRSLNEIQKAGHYDHEAFRSTKSGVDREKIKEDLQFVMTFGKKRKPKAQNNCSLSQKPEILTRQKRLSELRNEIEDRKDFLNDMIALGEGSRYAVPIKQEIAAKEREFSRVDKMTDDEFNEIVSLTQGIKI